MRRSLGVVVALAVLLAGCPASNVTEHSSGDAPPSVTVKALWKDFDGKSWNVSGVVCELQRIEGQLKTPVLAETTTTSAPLVFPDLKPGRYRLKARGQTFDKISEEFTLALGQRATVRIDVEAAETRRHLKEAGDNVVKGTIMVVAATGAIVLLGAVIVLAVAADSSKDDAK
jgi:hypothetical protein